MSERPDPLELAARALRHRDRSRRQLEERLERAGVTETERAEALETLERVGYVDDGRYAGARAVALAERGYGDAAIAHLLVADGLAGELVEVAIGALEPERERAARILARRGRSARVAAHLLRKGFSQESVEESGGGWFAADGPEA